MSHRWQYISGRSEFVCSCGVGHYAVWHPGERVHGCCGSDCCIWESFPGRTPKRGDLALCGKGSLGIILSDKQRLTSYPDGSQAQAWQGFHLTNALYPIGHQWSSRNPAIVGHLPNIFGLNKGNTEVDWADTIYAFAAANAIIDWKQKQPRTALTKRSREQIDQIIRFFL